ncbi:MAG: mechanosensitive ion channel [Kiritimatiellaeota bacterium]|nr:mechanosensitive ion channel [Kiritimatiellota bacterium]
MKVNRIKHLCRVATVVLVLLLSAARGAEAPASRSARIDEQIAQTQTLLAETTNETERVQWQQRLELLQQDRRNLQQRSALDEKEQLLAVRQKRHAIVNLRDAVRAVDTDRTAPAQDVARLDRIIRELRAQRAELDKNRQAILGAAAAGTQAEQTAELDQHLRSVDEELLARTQEREAADARLHLMAEAGRIEESLKALAINPPATLQLLREKRRQIGTEQKLTVDTADLIVLNQQRRDEVAASLALSQEKVGRLADELAVLNKKTRGVKGWLSSRPMYYSANMEKKYLAQRLQAQQQQLTAVDATIQANTQLRELYEKEVAFLKEDLAALLGRYRQRLVWPAGSVAAILVLYMLFSRLLLPLLVAKERHIVGRRLGGYLAAFLMLMVLTFFFFEDLKSVATILGIASAAVVIALQDMCSAFAGWFVIVASRKFTVGHRVEIDEHRGDIIDIQLLRTTLLEVNNWLGVDEPTGRIIVIPNSFVFKSKVFNYSYLHPFVWGNLDITVTFETPAAEAQALLLRVLEEESRDEFAAARAGAQAMEREYGVPDAIYQPKIYSIIADSGVLYRLVYVAHYRRVSATRSRINERILREFEKNPRLQFAYPTERHIPTLEKGGFPVALAQKP